MARNADQFVEAEGKNTLNNTNREINIFGHWSLSESSHGI